MNRISSRVLSRSTSASSFAQPPLRYLPAHPDRFSLTTSRLALLTTTSAALRPTRLVSRYQSGNSSPESVSLRTTSTKRHHQGATSNARVDFSLRSSLSFSLVAFLAVAAVGASVTYYLQEEAEGVEHQSPAFTQQYDVDMAVQNPPGRPGNLTPEQEEKLRKLWVAVFQTTGVKDSEAPQVDVPDSNGAEPETPKKKRFGLFRKEGKPKAAETSPKDATEDDKYGQTAKYHETLANHSPESIRQTIWTMVKHDHPDALILRFLRARKWDVEKALVMLVSTMNWRQTEMHLDDDIMKKGEGGALEDENNSDERVKTVAHDFLEQIRMGKSFLHGQDKDGRPICYVRVRLHKQGDQCEESLERYTVYLIETARMVLSPPVDTATIVFDMTGFSMANMDYTPVKFMIKCFEANYPESLGTVLINNAPWVFQGIWKIIKGWLDPVVASKVHFTNNSKDMSEFIPSSQILKELGGDEDWEYTYVEPIPGENDTMKDTATRDSKLQAREKLVKEFEEETLKWIKIPEGEEGKKIKARRDELAAELKKDYWLLDPYVRARSLYDRTGALKPDGSVDWYAKEKPSAAASNGAPAVETSADDVD